MNADGTGQTNLTNNPDWDGSPASSSDGSKTASVSYRPGVVAAASPQVRPRC